MVVMMIRIPSSSSTGRRRMMMMMRRIMRGSMTCSSFPASTDPIIIPISVHSIQSISVRATPIAPTAPYLTSTNCHVIYLFIYLKNILDNLKNKLTPLFTAIVVRSPSVLVITSTPMPSPITFHQGTPTGTTTKLLTGTGRAVPVICVNITVPLGPTPLTL